MAKTKISEFSATPANNTDIDSINIAEGCAPSGINDAIRELMAQLKDWQSGTSNDPMIIGASGSLSLSYGTANGVPYLNGSKVLTTGSALTFDGSLLKLGSGAALSVQGVAFPASGSGAEIFWDGSESIVQSYNRTSSAYAPLWLESSYTRFGINGTEQMRLTSTGLGIGTSSPAAKLNVNGNALFNGTTKVTSSPVEIQGDMTLGNYAAYSTSNYRDILYSASTASFGNQPVANIRFQTTSDIGAAITFLTRSSAGDYAERMRLDQVGNLGLGVTPSAWATAKAIQVGSYGSISSLNNSTYIGQNFYYNAGFLYQNATSRYACLYEQNQFNGIHAWYTAPSGTAGNAISFTQAMTLDASGNLLCGLTATGPYLDGKISAVALGSAPAICAKLDPANINAAQFVYSAWAPFNSGDNIFHSFETETTATIRGSIAYNRGAGLISYNATSDYRAKDILGPVIDSGSLIDSVPVYMGKMKGATQERPMFIAHEVPAYAHTGEKDAVDADGNPVYQQMDASALVPVMWAEIQSLRQRLAAAGIA